MPLTKVQSTGITDSAVTADKIGSNAVTTAKINADAVTDAKIADDIVGTEHLTAGEVDTTALGADAVTAAKIADDAISEEHLDVTAITGHSAITSLADTDKFLVSDASDSGNLKYVENQYLGGGATAVVAGGNLTSNTSELDIQSISGYKFYTLFLNNIKSINNNYDMKMRINGYTSNTYEYFNRYYKVDSSGSNVVTQNNSGDNNWPFMGDDLGNNDDEGLSLRIDFFAGGGQTKAAWVGFGRDDNHADGHRVFGSGQVDSVGLSRIQIYSGGGNIKASGSYPMEYTLIGYNQS